MLTGMWGKKIGMTQVFTAENTVIPVTVIDCNHWYVTELRSDEKNGYSALQVGYLRKRYHGQSFVGDWLKNLKKYFEFVREIRLTNSPAGEYALGELLTVAKLVALGDEVDIAGTTKGRGTQGVVKRHGFAGGRASHGPRFGRWPGSMGFMRSQGKIIKGKKLPGHMGVERCSVKNLRVVSLEESQNLAFIKGSVPGCAGSLLLIQKTNRGSVNYGK